MKLLVAGLGKMGMQIARKLAENGHEVIGYDRSQELLDLAATYGVTTSTSEKAAAEAFSSEPFVLWLMIPAEFVDAALVTWSALMPSGSTVIDGGNSDFRLTKERSAKLISTGISLVDIGTSGGVWGYENGFSMMIGGSPEAYKMIEPIVNTLSLPSGAYNYFGPSGSGHYVKMVHNAIEYGMMESLAEGYRMLKEGPYESVDLAAAAEVWQHGSVVTSWLNSLSLLALQENPNLDGIDGYVAESGEARWTLEVAKEMGIPLPAIQTSFDVRLASQKGDISFTTKMLAAMRNKFGGHEINKL